MVRPWMGYASKKFAENNHHSIEINEKFSWGEGMNFFANHVFYFGFDISENITHKDFNGHMVEIFCEFFGYNFPVSADVAERDSI
ncbi:MAG TPA: hypothetical protein PKM07_00830 [Spirochaetota bacterium]|nr:hypothetical protein [Spirochaetota bacterium]